jgi:hypothetical protein
MHEDDMYLVKEAEAVMIAGEWCFVMPGTFDRTYFEDDGTMFCSFDARVAPFHKYVVVHIEIDEDQIQAYRWAKQGGGK